MVLKKKDKEILKSIDKFLEENTDRCVIIAGADDPVQKRPCRSHKDKETSDLRKFVDPDLKKNCERWGILLGPEILVIDFDDQDKFLEYRDRFPQDMETCPLQTTKKGTHCFFLNDKNFKGSNIKFDTNVDLLVQESSNTRRYVETYPSPNKNWERRLGETPIQPMSDELFEHIKSFVTPAEPEPDIEMERTYLDLDDLERYINNLNPKKFETYNSWLALLFIVKNQVPPGSPRSIDNKYFDLINNFCSQIPNYDEDELDDKWINHIEGGNNSKKYGIPKLKELLSNCPIDKKKSLSMLEELGDQLDDAGAAKLFLELEPEIIFRFGKDYFIYDKDTGLWCDVGKDITLLAKYAMEHADQLREYGTTNSKINSMISLIKSLVENKYDLFEKFDTASHGYIQFRDGVYEMATGKFLPLSPTYFSLKNTGKMFVKEDKVPKSAFDTVNKILIDTLGEENTKYMLRLVGYAMYGDNCDRRFIFCMGDTGAGKGILQMFLKACFGDYISVVSASLYQKTHNNNNNGPTPERRKLQCCRIALSQEAEMGFNFDGNDIKILCGGGDTVSCRGLREDPREIRVQCVHIHLANDSPSIIPADDAVKDRVRYIPFNTQFKCKDDPNYDPKLHKIRDPRLKKKIDDRSTGLADAFFFLAMEGYREYLLNDSLLETMSIMKETDEYFDSETTWDNLIRDRYEVTRNPDDYVKLLELEYYIKSNNMEISRRKFRKKMPEIFKGVKEVKIGVSIHYQFLKLIEEE